MAKQNKDKIIRSSLNIIDISILCIGILVIAAGAYYYYRVSNNASKAQQVLQYTIEVQQKSQAFVNAVHEGDLIRDAIKGNYLGKVVKKDPEPATIINEDKEKGQFIKTIVPDAYNVFITIEGKGTETDESIIVEGSDIKIGKGVTIKGKGYTGAGYIVGIRSIQPNK